MSQEMYIIDITITVEGVLNGEGLHLETHNEHTHSLTPFPPCSYNLHSQINKYMTDYKRVKYIMSYYYRRGCVERRRAPPRNPQCAHTLSHTRPLITIDATDENEYIHDGGQQSKIYNELLLPSRVCWTEKCAIPKPTPRPPTLSTLPLIPIRPPTR